MSKKVQNLVRGSLGLSAFARLRLRTSLFLAGASVMVIEILGTRIIGPHFGVGLFVWTSLITVALLALALGYWLGGRLADRYPSMLVFSGILLAAAAMVAIIPLWREPALELGWKCGLRAGSLLVATILFFPPLFLLGMVSPFAIRLELDGVKQAGSSAGTLYAISTAGSVTGVVLAGFVLVPLFRVPTLLTIIAATLGFAAILAASVRTRSITVVAAAAVLLVGIAVAWPKDKPSNLIEARTCDGTDLRVVDHEGSRYLFVDQAVQTSLNAKGRAKDKYLYFLSARLLMARPNAKSAALIGLGGGGIVPLLREHGMNVDCVDLSPAMIEIAQSRFGFSMPDSQVHAMDGRVFLKQRPDQYDAIILDVFTGDRLAYSLVSREGLQTAKTALTRGGILILNTWGIDQQKWAPNQAGAAIRRTLKESFHHVLAVPAAGNLIFLASNAPITPGRQSILFETFDGPRHFTWTEVPPASWPDAPILTDDWNPIDVLDLAGLEFMRSSRRASFPPPVRDALAWE